MTNEELIRQDERNKIIELLKEESQNRLNHLLELDFSDDRYYDIRSRRNECEKIIKMLKENKNE